MTRRATVAELQECLNLYHAQATALRALDSIENAHLHRYTGRAGVKPINPPPLLVKVTFEGGEVEVECRALREAVKIGHDAVRQQLTDMGVGEVAV